ncbi:MAG: PQQ-binding-like beta-propeller repeat protein [Planctomycetaceae bacterium]
MHRLKSLPCRLFRTACLLCVFDVMLFNATGRVRGEDAPHFEHQWHQWRGPRSDGTAPHGRPPVHWDAQRNVSWQVELPGQGSSTPIVWGERIFLLTAVATDRPAGSTRSPDPRSKTQLPAHFYRFDVMCLNRADGHTLWQRTVNESVPHEGRHPTNGYASASPTTDGSHLYVSFGSRGIYCLDLEGNLVWKRELGQMRTRYGWGEATSPVLHGDSLVVNWDHEDQSCVVVLDKHTGQTRWKRDRDEPTTWATPLVVSFAGTSQLVVSGTRRVRSYNLADGMLIWECGGQTLNAIPSPVAAAGVVYCMSGYRGALACAIPLNSTGDLTDTDQILWRHDQGTPYVPSPVLFQKRIYFTRSNTGLLTCLDTNTGSTLFTRKRLPEISGIYASPVVADGRIYFVGRDGTTTVVRAGRAFEVLATNRLDAPIDASPAVVGDRLYLRATSRLFCIARPTP